jgi:hypothetical protein
VVFRLTLCHAGDRLNGDVVRQRVQLVYDPGAVDFSCILDGLDGVVGLGLERGWVLVVAQPPRTESAAYPDLGKT